MFKTKKCKLLIAIICVVSLLFQYVAPVLAVAYNEPYKQSDLTGQTINLFNSPLFERAHSYRFLETDGDIKMTLKTVTKDGEDTNWTNAIYCVDAEKSFPGVSLDGTQNGTPFKNFGNFFDANNTEVAKLIERIGMDNYKSLCWLANNIYLEHQDNEEKTMYDVFLNKVYGDYFDEYIKQFPNGDRKVALQKIKDNIELDDINAIQQYAMWYFSNEDYLQITEKTIDEDVYKNGYDVSDLNFDSVVCKYNMSTIQVAKAGKDVEIFGGDNIRGYLLNILFSYLIANAQKATTLPDGAVYTYPEFVETNAVAEVDGDNYKVGPFTITETNLNEDAYKITLTNGTQDLTEYVLKESNGTVIENLKDTVGKTFYIYVPTTQDISKVRIGIEYNQASTEVSFWEKVNGDEIDYTFQPLIWITNDKKANQYKEVPIGKSDLALRKYIISVNDNDSVARIPSVDATGLLNNSTTAEYKHKKSPLEVEVGDKIVYEIRVYNEGDTSATVKEIVDYIPEGLEFVKDSKINSTYKWDVKDNVATIEVNKTLDKINEESIKSKVGDVTGGLSNTYVQIELKVNDSAKADKVLTNVAEIKSDNINDRDSTPGNIDKSSINTETFSGNPSNDSDLSKNIYYKGLEDDDDFEKVKVKGKVFDLALKKFIIKVNSKAQSREPKVDTSSLATTTNATYTTVKTPVVVEKGDIVTYKIRVYNEGQMDGFAEEIADYIPEGLGFIVNHKVNVNNYWSISEAVKGGAKTVKLSSIANATKNVKLEDFENTKSLDEVEVVQGLAKITSKALSSEVSKNNILKAYDASKKELSYKDVEVVCVVLADESTNTNLRNIAEIKDDSTINSNDKVTEVIDRDSTPDTVKPDNYPGNDKNQDDHDYENLTMENYVFDLALQKFITKVGDSEVKDRVPTITVEKGKVKYSHTTDPLKVGNGDLVEYTIRVYNEGTKAGYAAEISDDLPKGLEFVVNNETNKKYGWELVDSHGQVTNDINQAKTVRTKYLSLEESKKRKEDCLLKPFDGKGTPDYKDVKIVFKVAETKLEATTTTEQRTIINTAEITDDSDEDGNPIEDEDSTPNNWKDGEDDIDKERVYVKYFDLALKKDLVKVIVIEGGVTTEYSVSEDQLFKVEINKKKLNSTVVKFVYNIEVRNEGEIEGYAKEVKDYIPEGLEFVSDDNPNWYKLSDNEIATAALADTLLKPGEKAAVQVTLKWINGENNLGKKVNVAEISKDENKYNSPDIDSTPNNKVPGEDDIDDAPVLLGISTGYTPSYYGLAISITVIMITGVGLIKKFVL